MPIKLTERQQEIADALIDFALGNRHTSYIAFSGTAGSGKSEVVAHVARELLDHSPNFAIAFIAPTGKASLVLRNKLRKQEATNDNTFIGTMHSLIYSLKSKKAGKMIWKKKDIDLSSDYDLLICDEASMLSPEAFRDLLSYQVPVIFVGDSFQLPPVEGKPFQPLIDTTLTLDEPHRQSLDSPIVKWANVIRKDGAAAVPFQSTKSFARLRKGSAEGIRIANAFFEQAADPDTIILCGKNNTRMQLNRAVRTKLGYTGLLPEKGERLMCLRNDRMLGVMNGQLMYVDEATPVPESSGTCYWLKPEVSSNVSYDPSFVAFSSALTAKDGKAISQALAQEHELVSAGLSRSVQKEPALFTYGYVTSVHKSQGSEWGRVLLYDERMMYQSDKEYNQWLYTAVTRSSNKLCILS